MFLLDHFFRHFNFDPSILYIFFSLYFFVSFFSLFKHFLVSVDPFTDYGLLLGSWTEQKEKCFKREKNKREKERKREREREVKQEDKRKEDCLQVEKLFRHGLFSKQTFTLHEW